MNGDRLQTANQRRYACSWGDPSNQKVHFGLGENHEATADFLKNAFSCATGAHLKQILGKDHIPHLCPIP